MERRLRRAACFCRTSPRARVPKRSNIGIKNRALFYYCVAGFARQQLPATIQEWMFSADYANKPGASGTRRFRPPAASIGPIYRKFKSWVCGSIWTCEPSGELRRKQTIYDLIVEHIPRDRPFALRDVMPLLCRAEPHRHFIEPTVRAIFKRVIDDGLVRKVRKSDHGYMLWAAPECPIDELGPLATVSIADAIEYVLRREGPLRPVELVLAVQQHGYRVDASPHALLGTLRRRSSGILRSDLPFWPMASGQLYNATVLALLVGRGCGVSDYLSNDPGDLRDDILHEIEQIFERRRNCFSFDNPRLIECYLDGKIHVVVGFGIGKINEQFVALFQREGGVDHLYSHRRVGGCEISNAEMRRNSHSAKSHVGCEQQAVLVNNVQAMNHPEIVPLPSLVRLYRCKNVDACLRKSFYCHDDGSKTLAFRRIL